MKVMISDRKVRPYAYLVFGVLFYLFFMLDMFFWPSIPNLLIKTVVTTVLFTFLVWEPVRLVALWAYRRWQGVQDSLKRRCVMAAILVPYALLLGFFRIYVESALLVWGIDIFIIPVFLTFSGISFLFISLGIVFYEVVFYMERWQSTQQETNELRKLNLQMQFDSLKVQIQPHFLFNTMNTLIGLIERDRDRAIRFTEDLSYVYRYLLEANQSNLINLEEEMKFARIYCSLLKTRYPEGIFLDEKVEDAGQYELPPLSLQILIENAVKHNIITRANPLRVSIHFDAELQRVVVSNNCQPKFYVLKSGHGLLQLKKKFELLSLPEIVIDQNQDYFSVSFSVIKAII